MSFFMIMLLYIPSSFSQPTSNLIFTNDVLVDSKTWTVDLYLQSTDPNPIELAELTVGLEFPDATGNGGTITPSWVAGTSELTNTAQIPTSPGNATSTATVNGVLMRIIKMAGQKPPGAGNGSMIATGTGATGPGTRIGTLQLANTVDWPTSEFAQPNTIDTSLHSAYAFAFNAYVATVNTNINAQMTIVRNLTGPLLPVELTSFVSNVSGRQVNLNWETKTEVNSSKYEIERALVGAKDATVTWLSVGTVNAAGNSNSPRKYSYTDKNLQAGKYQYRLKMIDFDGSYKLSDIVETEITVPKNFELSQNYPNPFNPTTKIDYQVPVDSKVIMEVYNIAGQKVVELVNQEQSAGYYSVDFGSSKLSSGVYIYRIVASDKATGNNFSSIKKMMLLK
jgi:hypothetical protein